MSTIHIKGIEVDTIIGVYNYERETKQKLIIDLTMQYDSAQAIASDNILHALDYHEITTTIHNFVNHSNYQLIETLAEALAQLILQNNTVENVEITVWKPCALEQAKNVGFSLSLSK